MLKKGIINQRIAGKNHYASGTISMWGKFSGDDELGA
jgi:hypothetical protein